MRNLLLLSLFIFKSSLIFAQKTPSEFMKNLKIPYETNPNQTVTYEEAIEAYAFLAAKYPSMFKFEAQGMTDIGEPLHIGILSLSGEFDFDKIRSQSKRIVLINNGIHPGEPEGIDATILLLRDFLEKPEKRAVLEHIVLVAIPVYNIGGCLNRNTTSRANQNGPESYGFRGNAKNYDLNRDFIKSDSKNAQSFNAIFQKVMPDVFIDNHTSNGADYQHVMTLIATQHNKLEAPLGEFLDQKMLPSLYADMEKKGWSMVPYVETMGETPDSGIVDFCDYGRYSTGYAAMWNCIGFMPETHMLKSFSQRLESTYAVMETILQFTADNHAEIGKLRAKAFNNLRNKSTFVLDWDLDKNTVHTVPFKGYAAKKKTSLVTGAERLWYDRSEPWERDIQFWKTFTPKVERTKPKFYLIPQAWTEVIERLKRNGVQYSQLKEDKNFDTESYYIRDFKTRSAYEGHAYHYEIQVETQKIQRNFRKGDILVPVNQDANRYIVETLEPDAPDSWFSWNFFESVLMQKEYFSAYVFEDEAAEFLEKNPAIKAAFLEKKETDKAFAADPKSQLLWVYQQTTRYEKTHRLYPVARIF